MCMLAPSLVIAGTWTVDVSPAVPGASTRISIYLRAEHQLASGVATIDASDWPHVELPAEGSEFNGYQGVCRVGAGGVITATLARTGEGVAPFVSHCLVSARIADGAPSTTFPIGFASASCADANAAPVPCQGLPGTLFIDGPPTLRERGFLMLPHAPPRGPSPAVIDAFDPADASSPAPVRSLATPRPIRVQRRGRGAPDAPLANRAVQSIRNAMTVTYASIGERNAALDAVSADPAVAAVFPAGGLPHVYLHPPHPRAREPLALYVETGICESFLTDHPDDREVEISGSDVLVYLPNGNDVLCGVPPPGVLPHLLNLPGLAAGDYTLRVRGRPYYPGDDEEDLHTLQFTVAPGTVATTEPRQIPGPALGWLVLLGFGLCLSARGRVTR